MAKKTKTKKGKSSTSKFVDLADLKALAKEMNSKMGLDPKIKVTGKTAEELQAEILENSRDEDGNIQIYHSGIMHNLRIVLTGKNKTCPAHISS